MLQQLKGPVPHCLPGRQMDSDQIPATYSGITASSKLNLTVEEHRAIKELREDQSRVVLTADKGVAMVVMQKWDYRDKALTLQTDTSTYRIINKDPTTRLKNKLTNLLRDIKQTGGLSDGIPNQCCPPKFYGLPKIHKDGTHQNPSCPVGVPVHLGWQRNWPTSFTHWLASLHTTLKTLNILYNTYKRQEWNQVRLWHHIMLRPSSHQFLWTLPYK